MPNKFSFFINNVDKDITLKNGENIENPTSGTIEYTVGSEDASDINRLINDSYELIRKIKEKKSTIPPEKLEESINTNGDLADFLRDDIIQSSLNNYRNLEIIKGDFKKEVSKIKSSNKFLYPDTCGNAKKIHGWPKYHETLLTENSDTNFIIGTVSAPFPGPISIR